MNKILALANNVKQATSWLVVFSLLCYPLLSVSLLILPLSQTNALAASSEESQKLSACPLTEDSGDIVGDPVMNEDGTFDDGFFDEENEQVTVTDAEVKNLTESAQASLNEKGVYNQSEKTWAICADAYDNITSPLPIDEDAQKYLDALAQDEPRIVFKNNADKAALTGDPCTKFIGTGTGKVCDEELEEIKDENGTLIGKRPKYYTDLPGFGVQGKWDAPKADVRILKTLVYLVTPAEQGGAGRERISVSKIIQDSKNDVESGEEDTTINADDTQPTDTENPKAPRLECGSDVTSPHYYDHVNASKPLCLAQAVDIDQIDVLRITTKITKKKRIGGNKVTYNFQKTPIKVAWQSDEGVQKSGGIPLPNNIFEGAQVSYSGALLELLDSFDLDLDDIDPSTVNINNLGGIAELIGRSLFSQLMNSPNGSLDGWDLASTLETFGRSYLSNKLGLVPGALDDREGDVVENIGRATVENKLGFAKNSLVGQDTETIYKNIGRRYLEDTVLDIKNGSLIPSDKGGVSNKDEILLRIGEGRIEEEFKLPAQSLRGKTTVKDVRESSAKLKLVFNEENANNIDERLSLDFVPTAGSQTDAYGYSATTFTNPTLDFIRGRISAVDYFKLVGSRTISSTIGGFSTKPSTELVGTSDSANDPASNLPTKKEVSGFDCTITISRFSDSNPFDPCNPSPYNNFITYFNADNSSIPAVLKNASRLSGITILTDQEETDLKKRMEEAKERFYLGNQDLQKDQAALNTRLQELYNEISAPSTGWLAYFQGLSQRIDGRFVDPSLSPDASSELYKANDIVDFFISQLKVFQESILSYFQSQGQTGQGAALNISGTYVRYNQDGTINNVLVSADPIGEILNGNFTNLELVGRYIAAQKLTPDTVSQFSLTSLLNQDLTPLYQPFTNLGFSSAELEEKGLFADDIQSIFQKGLGQQVFARVGENELLRTAWKQADLGNNQTINQMVNKAANFISFYSTRYDRLKAIGPEISNLVDKENQINTENKETIRLQLKNIQDNQKPADISSFTSTVKEFQVYFNNIRNQVPSTTASGKQIIGKSEEALHLIREIISGHQLNFNGTTAVGNGGSTSTSPTSQSCFSIDEMRSVLSIKKQGTQELAPATVTTLGSDEELLDSQSAKIAAVTDRYADPAKETEAKNLRQKEFVAFAQKAASCELDSNLNLPASSISRWLASPEHDYKSLSIAVGRASAGEDRITDEEASSKGEQLLRAAATGFMAKLIPGFSDITGKYGLTGEDLVSMLSGNSGPILSRVGSKMIDDRLHWKAGTAINLVSPTCYTDDGTIRACSNDEEKNIRLRSITDLGMQELGINLKLPATFSFTDNGSLLTNYGVSVISEALNLKANSFKGSFANVRSQNTPEAMLMALGLSNSPYVQALYDMRSKLTAQNSTDATEATLRTIFAASLTEYFAKIIENDTLDNLSSLLGSYWADPTTENATALAKSERDKLLELLSHAQSTATGSTKTVLDESLANLITPEKAAPLYAIRMNSLRDRITYLDAQYASEGGTFIKFITGKIQAEEITQKLGKNQLTSKLTDAALDKLSDSLPDGLKTVVLALNDTIPSIPNCKMYQFLTSSSSNPDCSFGNVNIDWSSVFTSTDPRMAAFRSSVYEKLIAPAFGNKFEQDLKLRPGTLQAMFERPGQAKELALDAGLNRIADQIFDERAPGENSRDNRDINYEQGVRKALHDAFLATFWNESSKSYQTNPNLDRATDAFQRAINGEIDTILGARSQRSFGTSITRSDISRLLQGDTDTLQFIALQKTAFSINKGLIETKDQRSSNFLIDYATIRQFMSNGDLKPGELAAVEKAASDKYIEEACAVQEASLLGLTAGGPDCKERYQQSKTAQDNSWKECEAYFGGVGMGLEGAEGMENDFQTCLQNANQGPSLQPFKDALSSVEAEARSEYLKQRREAAKKSLQYQVYDALAFKLDQNIPRGFARAMLDGSTQARTLMIGHYAWNALGINKRLGGLTAQEGDALYNWISSGFKNDTALTPTAFSKLENWANSSVFDKIGIKLPPGTLLGIAAWAKTGFASDSFTDEDIQFGNTTVPAVGSVLRDFAQEKIFAWADKAFGMQVGSTYRIYSAVQDYRNAIGALKAAADSAISLQQATANFDLATRSGNANAIAQTQAELTNRTNEFNNAQQNAPSEDKLQELKAAVITLAITSVFSSEIAAAEEALGLVPGTGAIAVGMLVNLITGAPISPITIALFIGLNLFGVYKVVIVSEASADGTYPLNPPANIKPPKPYEMPQPPSDYSLPSFNAQDQAAYQEGVKKAAQNKVHGLLQDLLLMPTKWGTATNDNPKNLWISQVFTHPAGDLDSLSRFISAPAPWNNPPGWGYGPLEDRIATKEKQTIFGLPLYPPKKDYRAGFFPDPLYWNQIHIRW